MTAGRITLEEIAGLSNEVSLLVRAGLPLEFNLAKAGMGHGARLRAVTESISEGLNQGHSLQDVIERGSVGAPRMLAAAITAGIQTGQLATTVEMMGDLAADLVELRRRILQAMTYPMIIAGIAWILFVVIMQHTLTVILDTTQQLGVVLHPVLTSLLQCNKDHPGWTMAIPATAGIMLAFWIVSGRASSMSFCGPERLLLLLPGVGALVRDLQFYTLSRMLSLLIERRLPLQDAMELAGAASGSKSLDAACRRAAAAIRQGDTGGMKAQSPDDGRGWRIGRLPPLLRVCLQQTSLTAERFELRLRSVTQFYRNRLEFNTTWLRTVMPLLMLLIVGGGTVLLYATALFWPVIEIYRKLGTTHG